MQNGFLILILRRADKSQDKKRRHAAPPRSPITNFESLPNECDEYEEKIVENIETKQKELQYPLYIPLAAPILLRYGTAVNDDVI
mmetsp:Transcript_13527/g.16352  ORF Transcript_13527/g.16352 Transcript_13527/m.16352 type:complete len:85 (+) Transcript_13527:272-526(+)